MSAMRSFSDARGNRGANGYSFEHYRSRMVVVMVLLGTVLIGLVARAAQLQLVRQDFYEDQGKARFTRTEKLIAHRGAIFDRNGEPLAVSTPVDAVWVNPRQ